MNTNNTTPTDILVNNINELSGWVKESATAVSKFTAEQTPLYIKEYVAWVFWSNLAFAIVGLLLIIAGIAMGNITIKLAKKINDYDCYIPVSIATGMGAPIAIIVGLMVLADSTPQVIKAAVAPRVVIVDNLLNKIK